MGASIDDLAALTTAIRKGSPGGEPWSPQLGTYERSVRALLEQHGFHGTDAQKKALEHLRAECRVETAKYRRSSNRVDACGLRVDGKPIANWTDSEA